MVFQNTLVTKRDPLKPGVKLWTHKMMDARGGTAKANESIKHNFTLKPNWARTLSCFWVKPGNPGVQPTIPNTSLTVQKHLPGRAVCNENCRAFSWKSILLPYCLWTCWINKHSQTWSDMKVRCRSKTLVCGMWTTRKAYFQEKG